MLKPRRPSPGILTSGLPQHRWRLPVALVGAVGLWWTLGSTPCRAESPSPTALSAPTPPDTYAQWTLSIDAPKAIQDLLSTHLDLARFQAVHPPTPSASAPDAISRTELERLVSATPAQVRELLQPLGYFNPTIETHIERGTPASPVAEVRLRVEPGESVRVGRLTLDILGPLAENADGGQAASQRLRQRLIDDWPLTQGEPFSQERWTQAKSALLASLKTEGYVGASYGGTVAQVDIATQQVRVFVVVDSGPRYHFGDVSTTGLQRYEDRVITKLIPFKKGEVYSERLLSDFQDRIQKLGLFESVFVHMEPNDDQADAIPIQVKVQEAPRRQSTLGVGVGANGEVEDTLQPRLILEHTDRQAFGQKWTSKTKGQIADNIRSVQQDFMSYPQNGLYRNLISGAMSRDKTQSNLELRHNKFRMGRTQDGERIERLYYAEWQRANIITGGTQYGSSAVSANYEWTWRDLDSLLLPTQGLASSARLTLGRAYAPTGPVAGVEGNFARVAGRMTYYLPLGNAWYAQGRIEAGEVLAHGQVAVPYTLLFRAGGDESVRGYDHQALGPSVNGFTVGGRVMTTGSLELAHPFAATLPNWWWAVFADAGDAAADWKSLAIQEGYGLGIRWRSPLGPLRLDVAYGARDHKVRPYINVGVTF